MIRVGVVCDTFEVGGQERGCLDVLRRLDRRRFAPHLYLFRPGDLLAEARQLGIPIVVGHDKPGADAGWTPADDAARDAWRVRLAESLRRDRIDVCLVYAWRDAIPAAQEAGVRALVERLDGPALTGRIRDKSACQRIVCESRHSRDVLLAQREVLRCRRDQVVVIPNGIDLARFDPARYDRDACRAALGFTPDDLVIGAVGRLAPEKDLAHLLRAVAYVMTRSHAAARIQVVLAGPDGGAAMELREEARRTGLAERVRFLGARSDVPEVLRALDVYVLTSLYEGSPFSLLEAIAMGLPVVATHVGAVPEMVRGNGYLVAPLRQFETGRALVELLAEPELRARLGRRSRALALRRHDLGEMIRRYEAVLLDALAASAAPAARERAG